MQAGSGGDADGAPQRPLQRGITPDNWAKLLSLSGPEWAALLGDGAAALEQAPPAEAAPAAAPEQVEQARQARGEEVGRASPTPRGRDRKRALSPSGSGLQQMQSVEYPS